MPMSVNSCIMRVGVYVCGSDVMCHMMNDRLVSNPNVPLFTYVTKV